MYTAHIGHRLIALHNARSGKQRTPREFFDEVLFPVGYDDSRFFQSVSNSPFDQASKQAAKRPLTPAIAREARDILHMKIETQTPDASFFVGGAAAGAVGTTSGQVTAMPVPADPDDVYASWVGGALGVGVEGGLVLLIDADEVLLALFDGWRLYRNLLNQTPQLKGNQINTWNGHWLTHRFDRDFEPTAPTRGFNQGAFIDRPKTPGAPSALATQSWVQVVFALARQYPTSTLTAYVYGLGSTNRTVGFVPMALPEVTRLGQLYRHLFGGTETLNRDAIERLYLTELSFVRACELGTVGLRALQPAKLREYLPGNSKAGKTPKSDPDNQTTLNFYQTWIIAMLNNAGLLQQATDAAQLLRRYEADQQQIGRGKSVNKNLIDEILSAPNRRQFIDKLTEIVKKDGSTASFLDGLVTSVLEMPTDLVPLFLTLLRFKFAVAKTA